MAKEKTKEITVNEEDEIVEIIQDEPQVKDLPDSGAKKKHSKKIAAIAAIAGVALLGYLAGTKKAVKDDDEDDEDVYYVEDDSESDDATE